MHYTHFDTAMMRRALQLAASGYGRVSPNPMVGAVITAQGRIIGEGFHRCFGGPHAEPNAIASVKPADHHLLKEATMYVTLEPCAHFGKTPPCARLIVDTGIPKVIVATLDPFPLVAGKGMEIMRQGGVECSAGLLNEESRRLNRHFLTAVELDRPFVLLKWAQSADGFIAHSDGSPVMFSTPATQLLVHRLRAGFDAIMVGTNTVINDNPRLNCRLWPCRQPEARPLKVSFDSSRIPTESLILSSPHVLKRSDESLNNFLHRLHAEHKVNSLIVEGGASTLQTFIDAGLADQIRVETSPLTLGKGIPAPDFHALHSTLQKSENVGQNNICVYDVKIF